MLYLQAPRYADKDLYFHIPLASLAEMRTPIVPPPGAANANDRLPFRGWPLMTSVVPLGFVSRISTATGGAPPVTDQLDFIQCVVVPPHTFNAERVAPTFSGYAGFDRVPVKLNFTTPLAPLRCASPSRMWRSLVERRAARAGRGEQLVLVLDRS